MTVRIEISHPDADLRTAEDRIAAAVSAAGGTLVGFDTATGIATIDAHSGPVDLLVPALEAALAAQFPAVVEMNPFYLHIHDR